MTNRSKDNIQRLLLGICGLSLSVSGWLITNKITDIDERMNAFESKMSHIAEDLAATKAEVMMHTASISYLERRTDRATTTHKDN